MKILYYLLIILLLQPLVLLSQAPGSPHINAGPDQQINCGDSANLIASPFHTGLTNTYTVSSIPYAPPFPFNAGNPILVNIDDRWSNVIQLPFNFCFYDSIYNHIVIGSNGIISFETAYANQFCNWAFTASIPSPSLPLNSIFGPYHDIDPANSGSMYQSVFGSYPCRTFVVNYYQIPMYTSYCNTLLATNQIVLYESTNVIEVYMQNKPLCSTWNSGNAVVGIQNSTGTVGIAAPGRNTSQWTTTNEAWRFTPNGTPHYLTSWWEGVNFIGFGNTISVNPTQTTTYTAMCKYSNCDWSDAIVKDSLVVEVLNTNNTFINNQILCLGETFNWRGNTYSIAGTYYDSLLTTQNCDSIFVLNLAVMQVDTSVIQSEVVLTANATNATFQWIDCGNNNAIIPGENSNIFTATANGLYAVIVTQNNCSDTSSCFSITSTDLNIISIEDFIKLYPNPSRGDFTIEVFEQTEIKIYDAIGRLKLQQTLYEGKNEVKLINMPVGVYYIKAQNNKGTETIRIILHK